MTTRERKRPAQEARFDTRSGQCDCASPGQFPFNAVGKQSLQAPYPRTVGRPINIRNQGFEHPRAMERARDLVFVARPTVYGDDFQAKDLL